jgi:hypothetical protein
MPRASPRPKTTSKAMKITPSKAVIKKTKNVGVKTRKTAIKTTTTHCAKMSRKQLIKSLSELGILTPSSLNNDTLRLLYDTNVNQAQNKQKTGPSNSSSNYNDTHDEGDGMDTAVSDDDNEETSTGLKFLQALQHEQTDDSDDEYSEEEGQHKVNNIPFKRKHKVSGVNSKQFIPAKIRNQAGKAFTLLSTPIAEEQFKLGSDGLDGRGDTDIETVPKGLRKAIIEGYNVNLIRLLLPRDNKKYSRDDDEDEDKSVYLKQKTDPRLDKNLTILEFILAFTRYLNII